MEIAVTSYVYYNETKQTEFEVIINTYNYINLNKLKDIYVSCVIEKAHGKLRRDDKLWILLSFKLIF